ncbi:nuclear movement protein [Thecamonas trahens ATCC 50062]|uniref:Nuclear migration protein nudC n=1 Tax=Thecamonas trahens ATCC 50062 TaxID=461836 RepID=A0A0L0DV57_THETB|nr:nuclear movement protein [Thecamonas trahens ATCC 50062]KNC55976.1 nuclear movement protein [Thecamonas trahens ATCC 50062]|eukprot:XP_013761023.1 nuclear movement protein [Thecamonas trahens ATCC 50062]
MDDERFDGLLLGIAQQQQGIDGLLATFFGFLGRKTDFFTGAGAPHARKVVLKSFKAAHARFAAAPESDSDDEATPATTTTTTTTATTTTTSAAAAEPMARGIEEIASDDDDEPASAPPPTSAAAVTTSTSEEIGAGGRVLSGVIEEDEDNADDVGKLMPNPANGANLKNYFWGQSLQEVDITVPLGVDFKVRSRDCAVSISKNRISVGLKNATPILAGELEDDVRVDDCVWTLEDSSTVCITLTKSNQMAWWSAVVKGEPAIATRKVQPENSKLSDLDPETASMVEKMMENQKRKAQGMPSIEDEQKMAAFESFKAQHPELDFSQAKIQ